MLAGLLVSLIFIILTPLIWRRLVETLEKVGWISGIIAALFTLLPFSIQNMPAGWKFAPIIIAGIILSLTAYNSKRRKNIKILSSSPALSKPIDSNTSIKPTQESESESSAEIEGLKQFKSRSELPPFKAMLSKANVTVDMTGLDLRIVVHQYMSDIKTLIYKDIRVTLYLLDPESKQVEIQSKSFHAVEDLKPSIQKSIRLLCEEKEKLPPYMRGNLIIRLYDYPPQRGIIITDDGHENAWIKVEARPLGSDSNSRPSEAWYRSYDPARYAQFVNELKTIGHEGLNSKVERLNGTMRDREMVMRGLDNASGHRNCWMLANSLQFHTATSSTRRTDTGRSSWH